MRTEREKRKEKREKRKEKREKRKEKGFRSVQCKGEKGRNTKQNKNKTKTKIKPMNFTTIYYYKSWCGSIKTKKKTENCQFKKQKKRERKPDDCLGLLKNYCRIF